MLTAEIKVNGKLLGHLYVVNKGNPVMDEDSVYLYDYEYFEIGSNRGPATGNVVHTREDGALTLIHHCIEDMGL